MKEKIRAGEIRLHELEEYLDSEDAVRARREYIEEETNASLKTVGSHAVTAGEARQNIENMIGAVQIPLGVAGPLRVNGEYATGEYYVPLATTEGALVASVNRGCSLITKAGGANVRVISDEMTRAPIFKVKGVREAKELVDWVRNPDNLELMRERAATTTRFGELLGVKPYVVGANVFLRFAYDTKDAMGMNMATIATDAICEQVEERTNARLVALSGNMCTDKKPAAINLIEGRGKTVVAEVVIPRETVIKRLRTTPETTFAVNYRKNLVGSARAGSLGFNAHAANVIAAAFIAAGQDPAHVVEGSLALTSAEVTQGGDLYFSVTLPALPVGTVGGGTRLSTQGECLDMMGVRGGGDPPGANAKKFAEIIGSAVLAGEVSLVGALDTRELSRAHVKLGR